MNIYNIYLIKMKHLEILAEFSKLEKYHPVYIVSNYFTFGLRPGEQFGNVV